MAGSRRTRSGQPMSRDMEKYLDRLERRRERGVPPRDSQGRFRGTPVHEDDYRPDSDPDSVTLDVPPMEQQPPFVGPRRQYRAHKRQGPRPR